MYQIIEIGPCDGVDLLSLPGREIALDTMFALLGTSCAAMQHTPRLELLVWIDLDGLERDREANARACGMLRAVFGAPHAAVCGPLLVTGGSWRSPTALDKSEAADAFAYLFGAAPLGHPERA